MLELLVPWAVLLVSVEAVVVGVLLVSIEAVVAAVLLLVSVEVVVAVVLLLVLPWADAPLVPGEWP